MALNETIEQLARDFATKVLASLRGLSLDEILSAAGTATRRGPGRPKGSTNKSARTGDVGTQILSTLQAHGGVMKSQDLRAALGWTKATLSYRMKKLIASGVVTMNGTRSTATYSAK